MPFAYSLDKEDFYTLQLYSASQSPLVKKKLRTGKTLIPVIWLMASIPSYLLGNFSWVLLCVGIAILWYLLFPGFLKWILEKDLAKSIDEHFKSRYGKPQSLSFTPDSINLATETGGSQFYLSEMEEIIEIPKHYFVRFYNGSTLILPKEKTQDLASLQQKIGELVEEFSVRHTIALDWKWK